VTQDLLLAVLPGVLALFGSFGGAYLSRKVEDTRRWQGDRRSIYARYLSLASVIFRDLDGLASYLAPAAPPSEEDDLEIQKGLDESSVRLREELQPVLGEVQLLASPEVADLAHGVSLALMDLADEVDSRSHYDAYYPISLRTNDLLKALREAMRRELGVSGELVTQQPRAWPWVRAHPLEVQKSPNEDDTPSVIDP